MPDQLSRLLLGKAKGAPRTAGKASPATGCGWVEPEAATDLERLTDSFHLNLTAFGLLSFFVGLFIVNSAVGLAFEQRLPMLRTLRSCGVSARMLNTRACYRAGDACDSWPGSPGWSAAISSQLHCCRMSRPRLRGLYGAPIPGHLVLKREMVGGRHRASACSARSDASAASLIKAVRLPVLASAQPQAWQLAQSALADMAGRGSDSSSFPLAGLLIWFGDSLLAGFAVLAALLLGAALLLPRNLLERALLLGERERKTTACAPWFWADSRQQLSGLSLALMALLLALAVNVGVGTMVESFSRTFLVWLDGRLAADVFVGAKDDRQAIEIKSLAARAARVQAILPGGRADTQFAGAPLEVLGLPDHPTYSENWPLLQSAPRRRGCGCEPGDTALVSEQLSRRLKLVDRRPHRDSCREWATWPLEVVGIYADYGDPKSQIAVNYAALTRRFPGERRKPASACASGPIGYSGAACGDARKIFRSTTATSLESGDDEGEIEAHLQPHVRRHLGAECVHAWRWQALRFLTSLLTLGNSRLPQLAPLWAIGVTRQKLAVARADQDHGGGADHGAVCAAARASGRLVPDRDRQCEGIRMAAAVRNLPAATGHAAWRCHAGGAVCGGAADAASGTDAAARFDPDLCQ